MSSSGIPQRLVIYSDDKYKGKRPADLRKQRPGTLTVNLFQRFHTTIVCGSRATHL